MRKSGAALQLPTRRCSRRSSQFCGPAPPACWPCPSPTHPPDTHIFHPSTRRGLPAAGSFDECKCNKGLDCPANNCTTTVYVGHRGSDAPGRSMKTGYQIQQINQYSITSFFWKLIDGVRGQALQAAA